MTDLFAYLQERPYPGRGILLGATPAGKSLIAYFIMGRSENSRNRIFIEEKDGIRTEAFDPSKLVDPSLIIYHPVRRFGDSMIVTNGDQTDTVRDYLSAGRDFHGALMTREFEPDGPNWTPRISGLLRGDGSYTLSILKSADGDPVVCQRFFPFILLTVKAHQLIVQHQSAAFVPVHVRFRQPVGQVAFHAGPVACVFIRAHLLHDPVNGYRLRAFRFPRPSAQRACRINIVFLLQFHFFSLRPQPATNS